MILNKENIDTVFRGLDLIFNEKFKGVESQWQRLATHVPSNTRTNDYHWIGEIPQMKEWMDERQIESLSAHKYSIENRDFEDTIRVNENELMDDNVGILKPQMEAFGPSGQKLPRCLGGRFAQ